MPDISDSTKGQIDTLLQQQLENSRLLVYRQLHRNLSQNAPVLRVLCLIERKNTQFRNTIGNLETLCSYCARSCVSVLDAKSSRVARLSKMFLPFEIVMCFKKHCWNLSSDVVSGLIAIRETRGSAEGFALNSVFSLLDCRLPTAGCRYSMELALTFIHRCQS